MGRHKKSKDGDREARLRRKLLKAVETRRLTERLKKLEKEIFRNQCDILSNCDAVSRSHCENSINSDEHNILPSTHISRPDISIQCPPIISAEIHNEVPSASSEVHRIPCNIAPVSVNMAQVTPKPTNISTPVTNNGSQTVPIDNNIPPYIMAQPSIEDHANDTVSCQNISLSECSNPVPVQSSCSSTFRYVGRSDPLPEFDPQNSIITMEHWIRKIEGISSMYGWDEKTVIFNCTSKLKGYARQWYEQLCESNLSWSDWKVRLLTAFPSNRSKLNMLRDLVNTLRRFDQDYLQFYYDKLALGNACGIPESLITEAIIGTINNDLIEVGAISAGCHDPPTLLKYLSSFAHPVQNIVERHKKIGVGNSNFKPVCHICKRRGHIASKCINKTQDKHNKTNLICSFCSKRGHVESDCFIKNKKCSYCNKTGHVKDECLKLKNRIPTGDRSKSNTTQNVRIIKDASGSSKYYLTIIINDYPVYAFIDFGSSCVTITQSVAQKINLSHVECSSNVVISGFGGSKIIPIGQCHIKIRADEATCETNAYIVPDSAQDIGVIVGQPFTDYPDVYVIKTPTSLKMYNGNNLCELPNLVDPVERVKLVTNNEIILEPGINKIILSCDQPISESVIINKTTHESPCAECVIPSCETEVICGKSILRVYNISNSKILISKGKCMARATITCGKNKYKIGENLNQEIRDKLENILNDFSDCFSGTENRIGKCPVKMHIELTDSKPIYYRPYRMSIADREKVRTIVNDLIDKSIVEECNSPYASPVILVPKKTGESRMCVDYRALNKITKKDRYPLPLIQDQLDRLSKQRVFSSLDVKSAYHCIQIDDDSKQYTAFVTPDGHYQYKRMSFGLVNAPSVFQRAMDEVLGPLRFQCATAYLDDILIYAENNDDALERLRAVLGKIKDANMTLRLDKCSFLVSRIEYLGHEVCNGEVRPSMHKLVAVHDFPTPTNVHQVRQFMGLANYFRKYVPGFATIARPITILTKKNEPWRWGEDQIQAYERIKSILVTQPVLALFNSEFETQIHTDASKIGLGGILLQKQPDGVWKPVAYASRQTTPAEQKYHSFELETLAVVMSLCKFKVYVTGIKFVIVTDCSALRWTWSKRDLSPRIARWWLEVQNFDFDVEYRAGKSMAHVDALSRNPTPSVSRITDKDLIESLQLDDDTIRTTIEQLKNEISNNNMNGLAKEYVIENGVLFRNINNEKRVVVPRNLRWSLLQTFHDNNGHVNFNKTYDAIRSKYWFGNMRRFIQKYVRGCISCQYAKRPTGRRVGLLHPIERIPVPFHTVHVDHLGPFCKSPSGKMYILAIIDSFTRFIWLEAVRDVSCKYVLIAFNQLIKTFGLPSRIISDRGTAFNCKDFKHYCLQRQIKHVMTAVASPRANGQIERFNRTILDTLVTYVGDDQSSWEQYLPKVQLGLNSNINNTTGKSPLELLYGFRPRLAGDIIVPAGPSGLNVLREGALTRSALASKQAKERFDKKRRDGPCFEVGDKVLAERKILRKGLRSGKLMPRFDGPFTVVKVLPHDRYVVEGTQGRKCPYKNVLSRDKLKLFQPNIADLEDTE